ncbi:MAG TPA: DUF4383 domain-containing protein [Micromonosporaceae bacterium]
MPVNHRLQPLYRVLAGLCGLYVLLFGIVGAVQTRDFGVFAQDGLPSVLGLRANLAFAVLSIAAGIVVLGGAIIGGNLDQKINLLGGIAFLVAGMAMMALMQSDLNILGFTISTCIVSFIIGLVLFAAGLYGRVGTAREAALEEQYRHGAAPDTKEHVYYPDQGPKPAEQTQDKRFA